LELLHLAKVTFLLKSENYFHYFLFTVRFSYLCAPKNYGEASTH
jgi:hypothetical protein